MFSAGRGLIDGKEVVGRHTFMRLSLLINTGMAPRNRVNGVGLEGAPSLVYGISAAGHTVLISCEKWQSANSILLTGFRQRVSGRGMSCWASAMRKIELLS